MQPVVSSMNVTNIVKGTKWKKLSFPKPVFLPGNTAKVIKAKIIPSTMKNIGEMIGLPLEYTFQWPAAAMMPPSFICNSEISYEGKNWHDYDKQNGQKGQCAYRRNFHCADHRPSS